MRYKGILLDIDNTLYGYDENHKNALSVVVRFMSEKFALSEEKVEGAYLHGRHLVQIELGHTAASHNRLLYFQKMLELLEINPLKHAFSFYNLYWNTFLGTMKLFKGVDEFLEKYQGRICLVTDLTVHIQYRKIDELNLSPYVSQMVTSEEAGREKPHPYIFLAALKKMKLQADEVCMIGDSFKKDIVGATNVGIDAIWLNREQTHHAYDTSKVREIQCFEEINQLI